MTPPRRFAATVGLLAGVFVAGAASAACSQADVARAAAKVIETRTALRAIHVDDMETDVPQAALMAVLDMKMRQTDLIDAEMACAAAEPDMTVVQAALVRDSGGAAAADAQGYGAIVDYDLKRWPGGLIGVVARTSIQCGSDAGLFVFARRGGVWREALRWYAPPYKDISGAWEAFDYKISPPDAHGQWFVAATNIKPWCSSTWSEIRWGILKRISPISDPAEGTVLLAEATEEIWWGNDDTGRIKVGPNDAEFRWHGSSIDNGVHNREFIRHFRIDGNLATRVAPIAASPRDFVDEWMVTPWYVASNWTAPAGRKPLEARHESLLKDHAFDFGSILKCADRPDHVQVQLTKDDKPAWYFQVAGTNGDYRMNAVSRRADARCRGANLLDSMATK